MFNGNEVQSGGAKSGNRKLAGCIGMRPERDFPKFGTRWIDRPTGRVIRRYERWLPVSWRLDVKKVGQIPQAAAGQSTAAAAPIRSVSERRIRLKRWVHVYNCHRHHTAVGGPPASRAIILTLTDN